MKQYIISTNFSSMKLNLVCFEGNTKIKEEEISLSDLKNNIDAASIIYFLLDSSKISTFNFKKEESENKEKYEARFFADKEDFLVNDISNQKFFCFSENNNDLVFLIDKQYYENIQNELSKLNNRIFLIPEYFLLSGTDIDVSVNTKNKLLIKLSDGRGFSIPKEQSDSFLESIAIDDLEEKSLDLEDLQEQFLASNDSTINFFKFRVTLANVLNRLMITQRDVLALSAIFLIMVSFPFIQKNILQSQIDDYKKETLMIFKTLNPSFNRVINARAQIDQLLENQQTQSIERYNFDNSYFRYIDRFNLDYVKSTQIVIETQQLVIEIDDMPASQFNLAKSLFTNFGVVLINEEINENGNKVSGKLTFRYS